MYLQLRILLVLLLSCFFFQSEAKRYAGADVKQRKKKGWPYFLFNRNFRNYSIHYLRIVKRTPRKKRLSLLKIGRKKLEDHTKTLLSKICPPRKGQRLRRTLLPYLTGLSKNCDMSKNCESPRKLTWNAGFTENFPPPNRRFWRIPKISLRRTADFGEYRKYHATEISAFAVAELS